MQNKTISTNLLINIAIGIAFFLYVKSTVKKEIDLPSTVKEKEVDLPSIVEKNEVQTNYQKATTILSAKINVYSVAILSGQASAIVGQIVSEAFKELSLLGYGAEPKAGKFELVVKK